MEIAERYKGEEMPRGGQWTNVVEVITRERESESEEEKRGDGEGYAKRDGGRMCRVMEGNAGRRQEAEEGLKRLARTRRGKMSTPRPAR